MNEKCKKCGGRGFVIEGEKLQAPCSYCHAPVAKEERWEEMLERIWTRAHIPDYAKDAKTAIHSLLSQAEDKGRLTGLEEARECVPDVRGTEMQVEAAHCGLYHWNDCRSDILAALDSKIKELEK